MCRPLPCLKQTLLFESEFVGSGLVKYKLSEDKLNPVERILMKGKDRTIKVLALTGIEMFGLCTCVCVCLIIRMS